MAFSWLYTIPLFDHTIIYLTHILNIGHLSCSPFFHILESFAMNITVFKSLFPFLFEFLAILLNSNH